ncbi:MAG: hypothetical protein JWL59_4796 [Chthoniobacteraceae bacterium]|nr:hypothetical protein [Chthoniobacteraceae bacterium]
MAARAATLPPEQIDFFESKIRPVLAAECYECHNGTKKKGGLRLDYRDGWKRGGDSGDAIVPGDPANSLLIKAIRHLDAELKMPAKAPRLDEQVIANFEKWIEAGAPDPRDDPPSESAGKGVWPDLLAARRNWWALLPVQKQAIPEVKDPNWSVHPVDRFLLSKLEEKGLQPAQPSDPRTLIRRLTFMLTGLPPTPVEVEKFASESDSQAAVTDATERLLSSPRFGEHWARHWMDLVRYAETHGSESDPDIPQAWRYRDYLVRAFNADLPYDALVREHLAGDLLANPRANVAGFNESILGTAHLRLIEHGFQPIDTLDDQVKAVDSQIDVVSKAFQGLTVSCARCHDHKFDAISQRDYYALYGIFASCRPAQVIIDTPALINKERPALEELRGKIKSELATVWTRAAATLGERLLNEPVRAARAAALHIQVAGIEQQISTLEAEARRSIPKHAETIEGPMPAALWNFTNDARDAIGGLHGHLYGGAEIKNGRLLLNGSGAYLQTDPLIKTLAAKTLEAWITIADLGQSGGGVLSVEAIKTHGFDSIVYAEKEPRRWVAGSELFRRSQNVAGELESAKPAQLVQMAIVYGEDGLITLYKNGVAYGAPFKQAPPRTFEAGDAHVLLGLRHTGAGNGFFKGEIEEARLYDRALTAGEIEASFRAGTPPVITAAQISAALSPVQLEQRASLKLESERIRTELSALEESSGALQKALGEPGALQPWMRMQAQNDFAAAWTKLVADQRAAFGEISRLNREGFRPVWDLSGPDCGRWFYEGPGLSGAACRPGEFSIEREGDRILFGLYPAGILTHRLSDKHGGLLTSPRFKIESDSISVHAFGGGGAMVRVIVDNYPLPDNSVFPKALLEKQEAGWIRLDTAYRKGSWAYIEFGTREDLTRPLSAGKPAAEGRSHFGVTDIVFHDGKEPPAEENIAQLALFEGGVMKSKEELAAHYQATLEAAINAWNEGHLNESQRAFLDFFVRRGLLPVALNASANLGMLVQSYRQLEAGVALERRAPGVLETAGFDAPLLQRGDHLKPGQPVGRRFLEVLGSQPYQTPLSGRLELANELASPRNPLTARVMVNRIWHWVFGRGLVPTVDNFGRMGEKPTHPELLDFLAGHFVEHGWSVKEMVQYLAATRAFQMSSDPSAMAMETDPGNVWLSHMRVRRIEAESIRDELLAVSGGLDLTMEGPGQPPDARRRSIYLQIRRTNLNPFLQVFDAPQPFTTLGRRDSTNVPAQSLTLLNSPFVIGQARAWAQLLVESAPTESVEGRVRRMFEAALARPPSNEEAAASIAYLGELGEGIPQEKLPTNSRVWQDFAQSLFNLKEFIYVR